MSWETGSWIQSLILLDDWKTTSIFLDVLTLCSWREEFSTVAACDVPQHSELNPSCVTRPAVDFILPLLMRPLYSLERTSDYSRQGEGWQETPFCVSYKALWAQLHGEELSSPEEAGLVFHLGTSSGPPVILYRSWRSPWDFVMLSQRGRSIVSNSHWLVLTCRTRSLSISHNKVGFFKL